MLAVVTLHGAMPSHLCMYVDDGVGPGVYVKRSGGGRCKAALLDKSLTAPINASADDLHSR
jgi:hypothetical protein